MLRRLLPLLVIAALSVGCAASEAEDDSASSNDALSLTTLSAATCKKPVLKTKPSTDKVDLPIPGTANTTIAGCIVGKNGETGKDTIARLSNILGDTQRLGLVTKPDGATVFAKFTPGATSGSLSTGLVQDVDVTLAMFASPSSRLRITRHLGADGVYSIHITNVTAFRASLAFVPVTAILPDDLELSVQMKPEANGLTVTGNGSVQLQIMRDQASEASELVHDLFTWLTSELAK